MAALILVIALLVISLVILLRTSKVILEFALGFVIIGLVSEFVPLCAGALIVLPALFVPTIKAKSVEFSPKLMSVFRIAAFQLSVTPSIKYLIGDYEPLTGLAGPDEFSDSIRELKRTSSAGSSGRYIALPRRLDCPGHSASIGLPCLKLDDGRVSQCTYTQEIRNNMVLYFRERYTERHLACGAEKKNSRRAIAVSGGLFSRLGIWIDKVVWDTQFPQNEQFDYYFTSAFNHENDDIDNDIKYVIGGSINRNEAH